MTQALLWLGLAFYTASLPLVILRLTRHPAK